jgi:hypothetical protein
MDSSPLAGICERSMLLSALMLDILFIILFAASRRFAELCSRTSGLSCLWERSEKLFVMTEFPSISFISKIFLNIRV